MEDNRLISMVDFVFDHKKRGLDPLTDALLVMKYANFLNQPLNIGQFVPAIDGEVITGEEYSPNGEIESMYQQAKDNVIFEGYSVWGTASVLNKQGGKIMLAGKTIQDLIKYKLTLTKYGQQQAGL